MKRESKMLAEALLQEGPWTDKLKRLMHRRNPEGHEGALPDNASTADRIRKSDKILNRERTHDIAPKFTTGSDDEDRKNAARQAFTAWDYADEHGHHPDLWKAVQGSPYEKMYRRKFAEVA